MDAIIRGPRPTVVETDVPLAIAIAQLARALPDEPRIETDIGTSSDRRMVGGVDAAIVHVAVRDASLLTRRKSWNVAFDGVLESMPGGAVLKGAIDMTDRAQLYLTMWMFRIAGVFVALLAVGLQLRDLAQAHAPAIWPAAGGILLAILVVVVVRRMETEAARAAEDDARVLAAALNRLLRE